MTTNYTPGPWKAQRDLYNTPYEELGFGIYSEVTHLRVANIEPAFSDGTVPGHTLDEQDPTARLIAAAPELVEALREILALAEKGVIQRNETGKPQWSLTTALTEISRTAILKATGK